MKNKIQWFHENGSFCVYTHLKNTTTIHSTHVADGTVFRKHVVAQKLLSVKSSKCEDTPGFPRGSCRLEFLEG